MFFIRNGEHQQRFDDLREAAITATSRSSSFGVNTMIVGRYAPDDECVIAIRGPRGWTLQRSIHDPNHQLARLLGGTSR